MHRGDLRDAVVVLTGASSGVGRAAAHAFADAGSALVLVARGTDALAEVAEECGRRGAETAVVAIDIGDRDAAQAIAETAAARFGRVDVWVEAAAVLVAGPPEAHTVADVERLLRTNVLGSTLGALTAVEVFQRQGHGVLIVVSSLLGQLPSPLVPVYVASKFALRGLALSLRLAVADAPGVAVSLVLPGPVDTPMFQRAANRTGRRLRAIPPATAPERVAAAIVANARRPRRQRTAGVVSHAILAAHRVSPRLTERLVGEWSRLTVTRPEPVVDEDGARDRPVPPSRVSGGWRRGRLRRRLGERVGAWSAARRA